MSFIAGILTFLLVINCLLLILLVLMQLPKKDAGAGVAFGGAAADALFGAGSGNFLTQMTRYATIALFALALVLGNLEIRLHNTNNGTAFEKNVEQKEMQTPISTTPPVTPAAPQPAAGTNALLLPPISQPASPPATSSNAPAVPTQSK